MSESVPKKTVVLRDGRPTKTVSLPSFPDSVVEIWPSLLLKDHLSIPNSESMEKQGLDSLAHFIKSWNFTNDAGELLPINAQSVAIFPAADAVFLFEEIAKFSGEQKKS